MPKQVKQIRPPIYRVAYLVANLNQLAERYHLGKRIQSRIPNSWGICVNKSMSNIESIVRRYNSILASSSKWKSAYSVNRRALSNIVYHYHDAWNKSEYRNLCYLNIDALNESRLCSMFRAKAFNEAASIETRAREIKRNQRLADSWPECKAKNVTLVRDNLNLAANARNRNWDLVVKEANLRFNNETKDQWEKRFRQISKKLS